MRRVRLALALGLAGALILGACGGGGDEETADTTTTDVATTTAAEPTTTTSSSSTVPETTTTAAGGGACPAVTPIPENATSRTTVLADVDGDGADDVVDGYRSDDSGLDVVSVQFATGGGAEHGQAVQPGSMPYTVVGGADVNGDGRDELWVRVGSGASTVLVSLFSAAECSLSPLSRDGEVATFPVGATVLNLSGVECRDLDGNGALDVIVELSATSTDGQTYAITETELVLDPAAGLTVLAAARPAGSIQAGDPRFQTLSGLTCGDVLL